MSRKNSIILITLVALAALGVIAFKTFVYDHGTVSKVGLLKRVFNRAGTQINATFTNSLIQQFPFEGPIAWKLQFIKMQQVILSGKIDTNALRQFARDHSSTNFIWYGVGKNGQNWEAEEFPTAEEMANLKTFNGAFRVNPVGGGYAAVIEGSFEFPACIGVLRSWSPDWIPTDKQ